MAAWIDQLNDTELKVFTGELKSFPDDAALDAAIIKWLDAEGRAADATTIRLHRYIRNSAMTDPTGAEFLAFCDANNVEGYAGTEGKACITELRGSEELQAQTLTVGDLSWRMTEWRKEVDAEHHEIWGEWWDAWQAARQERGIGTGQPGAGADESGTAFDIDDLETNYVETEGESEGDAFIDRGYSNNLDLNVTPETPTLQFGEFAGPHAWVNGLDNNQWAAFSGAEHTGIDHNTAMRVWATGSGRSEVTDALDLYDYLFSLAATDSTTTAPEFLAWYDGGWAASADTTTRARVEALRRADAATQNDPAQVGSAVHQWRRSLDAQISGWSDQWWADWQAAQAAGGYPVGINPATTPAPASQPEVELPHEYSELDGDEIPEHEYQEWPSTEPNTGGQAPGHEYEEWPPSAQTSGGQQPARTDSSGYLEGDLSTLPPVSDEEDEQDEQDEDDDTDRPDLQADEHGYVHNLDALSQPDRSGEIVRAYAEDNALDKLFEYFNANDITGVLASVQLTDGGAALDALARDYPAEFGGWFDAAASQEVQTALLTRPMIAGVIRAHRAATDPGSRQPRKDAVPAEPVRMKLQPAQLDQIDAANKAAIASIERGGELTWFAGGIAVLFGQNHQAEYLNYYDDQNDRVSGTMIVRRIRIGTGPVVFFDVPPAKQEMVASAARRATSRKPVFESKQ